MRPDWDYTKEVEYDGPEEHIGDDADPIVRRIDGFYFYDETWSQAKGPYLHEEDARTALIEYSKTI